MNIGVKELFDTFGNKLTYGTIVNGDGFYDLYDDSGNLVAMDGEPVEPVEVGDHEVVVEDDCGEKPVRFKLTMEEFELGCIGD